MRAFFKHVFALTKKEILQISRDRASILLGVFLPLVLIVLFGEGLSFDIKDVRVGIVSESIGEPVSRGLTSLRNNHTFLASDYATRQVGMSALEKGEIEALVIIEGGEKTTSQILIDGVNTPRASLIQTAITQTMMPRTLARGGVQQRIWFNESALSQWYLVPGLFVVILTMSGTMLTSLVIAREWERGTMEAMLATPISMGALLLSKVIPYFLLGMSGWALCFLMAYFYYDLPLRGSFALLFVSSSLYMVLSLAIGLVISAKTRSQFLSSQIALLASFLPAILLSGFIFDLRSAPEWANVLAHAFPPVYYLDILKVAFLTGGMSELVIKNMGILTLFTAIFLVIAYRLTPKRIRK